jgi:mono/diheme cytochrome c family protein
VRRPLIALALAILGVGAFTGGLAWFLDTPPPPPTADRTERLFFGLCVSCHGVDGRGSWRARLFLIRPGDLAAVRESDRYLFDIVKHGGAPIGRPGMPGFGGALSDGDIDALVAYIRRLGRGAGPAPAPRPGASLHLFDPHEMDLVALPAHGQTNSLAGLEAGGVQLIGIREHRHQLHGTHAQRSDRLVTDQNEVGRGPLDHLPTHLVRGRSQDRAPQAHREGGEQQAEHGGDEPGGSSP